MGKAVERQRGGSAGVYDVTVTRDEGFVIAEFRGISRIVEGEWVPGAKLRGARGVKLQRTTDDRRGPEKCSTGPTINRRVGNKRDDRAFAVLSEGRFGC